MFCSRLWRNLTFLIRPEETAIPSKNPASGSIAPSTIFVVVVVAFVVVVVAFVVIFVVVVVDVAFQRGISISAPLVWPRPR